MANWALLQEQLTGLPVYKRAKHGIHFQQPDGQIQANFCGKPAHYLDGAIWKPIDTKLIAKGTGWYGCPHSDVLVHPDGRVAVEGTTYAQYTALPGTVQNGLVDNDRIVREFTGGRQYLYVTEDGFRQEIILDRIPTLTVKEAQKLIATVSGSLPLKYYASLLTATDANGNTYTYDNLTNLRTWLTNATYPVVIDPDFSVNTGVGGDNRISSVATVSNYGGAVLLYTNASTNRTLLRFDLSSISSSATCSDASLKMYCAASITAGRVWDLYQISNANGDWVEGSGDGGIAPSGTSCWIAKAANGSGGVTTTWAGSEGCNTAGTDYVDTIIATVTSAGNDANTLLELPFNASGKTVLQGWFGDATNNGFRFINETAETISFHSGEATTEGYRPMLTVLYTAGAGGILRGNFTGNMQMMAGGFNG